MKLWHIGIVTNVYVQYPMSNVRTQASEYQKQNRRAELNRNKKTWVFVALGYVEVINVPVWHMIAGGFEDPGWFTSP